jgi:hypothetical protein
MLLYCDVALLTRIGIDKIYDLLVTVLYVVID